MINKKTNKIKIDFCPVCGFRLTQENVQRLYVPMAFEITIDTTTPKKRKYKIRPK